VFYGIHFFRSSSKRFLLFTLLGSAVRCQEEQLRLLAVGWRSVACAVKDAVLAFIGAQRRSLTGEARGLSAGVSAGRAKEETKDGYLERSN
jgi:hypothetical protein